MTDPASIRYKNPGAMWGGSHAKQWGAVDDIVLKDGQSNHIAVFPTFVQGAAAQFDLWRKYSPVTIPPAIKRWSGGSSNAAYAAFLVANTGIKADEPVTVAVLSGPSGLVLMKQQARWEAGLTKLGQAYPMSDDEWRQAQQMVFGKPKAAPSPPDIPKANPVPQPAASGGFFVDLIAAIVAAFKRR